jgi:hypothetical protein
MLNFLLKTRQNKCAAYTCMVNGTERMYAYDRQREPHKKWCCLAKHFKKKHGVYHFFITFVVTKTYIS